MNVRRFKRQRIVTCVHLDNTDLLLQALNAAAAAVNIYTTNGLR